MKECFDFFVVDSLSLNFVCFLKHNKAFLPEKLNIILENEGKDTYTRVPLNTKMIILPQNASEKEMFER